ncbi:uncharacterized protein LOC123384648 isoform X2 [Felis catus]|uniref:uncharacterized protein LOC123384648 isoform X2 n=1 Tax=Felis catus TaxID=9685 RepID=UPI001D19C868|nr:uncharacterized protein LOC123384648 isoform X2 [Felis catus]
MALLASWGGVLRRSKVRLRLRGSGQNGVTSYPVCSPGSAMAHPSSVFSSPPLPAFPHSVTRPQAVPRSRVLPQTRLFSPAPYSRRTAALTRSAPPREGLTGQRPNVGCSQERPLDPAAAGAPRLRPEASPPQKTLARQSSSSVSGMVENGNTRLAPGFTLHDLVPAPANLAAFRGLPGPGGFNSLHQMSFRQRSRLSPVARAPPGPRSVPGDSPFPPEPCQASNSLDDAQLHGEGCLLSAQIQMLMSSRNILANTSRNNVESGHLWPVGLTHEIRRHSVWTSGLIIVTHM